MPDDDIALSEKRIYGARREATRAYVASAIGVTYVASSDDQIGRFGLEHRCEARDVAGDDGQLLVATDEDVLVGTEDGFEPAGFGPAVAVGVGADPLAADPDGRVARLVEGTWESLGEVDGVRAIDGDLVAAADGVYHVNYEGERRDPGEDLSPDLSHVGLDDARDVAGAGPFVATGNGVYHREDGWNRQVEGDATVVSSVGRSGRHVGRRAHAVVDGTLCERDGEGEWRDADAPDGQVVDVAYGDATFAVTGDGTVLLDPVSAKDGSPAWRSRSLGLADVVGVAVP